MQVEWPLNMVVDRSTQNLYQALLRHLLGLAMVERELHIIWRTYQSTRALFRRAPLSASVLALLCSPSGRAMGRPLALCSWVLSWTIAKLTAENNLPEGSGDCFRSYDLAEITSLHCAACDILCLSPGFQSQV